MKAIIISGGSLEHDFAAEYIKKYQPDCLINSRIGNGLGDYTSTGDNEIPEDQKDALWEAPATMNHSWGYTIEWNNEASLP